MSASKVIKMNFNGEIKRSTLPESFEELKKVVIRAYSIAEEELKAMSISYMDDEGDTVLISDEFDYRQALIFLEKENNKCLKVNLEKQPELNKQNSHHFEIISRPEENFIFSRKTNKNINYENTLNTINEMRLSRDLVKSEILSKNEGFENDSNEECCKELINNMRSNPSLKLNEEEVKTEIKQLPQSQSQNPVIKIEEKIVEQFDKIKNKLRKNAEKIGKITKKFADKVLSKIKNQKENPEPAVVESTKKKVRDHIKKVLEKKLNKLKSKLIKETWEISDKEIDRLFTIEKKSSNEIKSSIKINSSIHNNVRCDGCNKHPIIGSRYKCSICQDFDYCEDCENKNIDHQHAFIKIRSPQQEPIKIITSIRDEENKNGSAEVESKNSSTDFYLNKLIDLDKDIKNNLQEIQKVLKGENLNLGFDLKKLFEWCGSRHRYQDNYDVNSLSSKCLTDNLTLETRNHINEIRKSIRLNNNGNVSWPRPCYFTCIQNESNIYGKTTPIRVKVDPESQINVDICLNLKEVIKSGEYTSVWQLQNNKRQFFGQKVILKIKVNFSEEIIINPQFVEIPREIFLEPVRDIKIKTCADLLKTSQPTISHMDLVQKMKQIYDLRGIKDNQILYAVVISQGNMENAFNLLQSRRGRCNYYPKSYN
jgi:hypothetical protein